jgi:hypothetical protein
MTTPSACNTVKRSRGCCAGCRLRMRVTLVGVASVKLSPGSLNEADHHVRCARRMAHGNCRLRSNRSTSH